LNHGAHEKPSRWRRKVLGLPVVVWLWGIAGTALAVAGFAIILSVNGSLTAANGVDVRYTIHTSDVGTAVVGTPTCTVGTRTASSATLTMGNAKPGDVCRFRLEMTNVGTSDARLNGFNLGATHFAATVNTGSDFECGHTLTTSGAGMIGFADVRIEALPTLTPGATYTFVPATDGFDWRIPSMYVAAECA
jgi:hypothetical protein